MTNATFVAGWNVSGQGVAGVLRRVVAGFEMNFAGLRQELAEAKQELRLRRGLRALDRRQLRDIGLDRGAC